MQRAEHVEEEKLSKFLNLTCEVVSVKGIYVPISWQVMRRIIGVRLCVRVMMGRPEQIGLHAGCLVCEGF